MAQNNPTTPGPTSGSMARGASCSKRPSPVFLGRLEAPLAYACAGLALATVIWKTVGLGFLPGWEDMFGPVGSQYPRRVEALSPAWSVAYFLMYGVLGTAATLANVLATRRRRGLLSPVGQQVQRYARLHGLFHVVIAIHHTAWAATAGVWGHLTLEQFEVPGLYWIGGASGLATGLHGLRLLSIKTTDLTAKVVRSKIAVDGVSLITFLSVFVCFPMNALGLSRSPQLERISWVLVFVGPLLWLMAIQALYRDPPQEITTESAS